MSSTLMGQLDGSETVVSAGARAGVERHDASCSVGGVSGVAFGR